MSDYSLVYPMLALVLLTFGVAVVLFRARVRSVREGRRPVSSFRVLSPVPRNRNFCQAHPAFHQPVRGAALYAACPAAMAVGATGTPALALAWGYVVARLAHAWVHLGANRVRHRFRIYFISWIFLLALWIYMCTAVALK